MQYVLTRCDADTTYRILDVVKDTVNSLLTLLGGSLLSGSLFLGRSSLLC